MSLDISVITYPQAVALRMAIDYTIIIDAAVAGLNPSLASELKKECLAMHRRLLPWYLDLQTISCEYSKQQEERTKEPSIKRSSRVSAAAKNNRDTSKKLIHHIVAVGKKRFVIINRKRHEFLGLDDESDSEDSYTEYSDSGTSKDNWSPSTPDKPSIYLSYRKHSFWPNVTTLARQSWRPCITLADPRYSHNLRVSRNDLSTWRLEPKPTSFQPRCLKVKPRGFACGLPNKVRIAGVQWKNPDGGAPKTRYLDDSDLFREIDEIDEDFGY
ncbi:hypothetical protein KCU65_g6510, partial [Aureobasidium melanogenum]